MNNVNFKGSIKDLSNFLQTLILIYGENAKIVDIQKSIAAVRG